MEESTCHEMVIHLLLLINNLGKERSKIGDLIDELTIWCQPFFIKIYYAITNCMTYFYVFVLSCVCYVFVRVCLYVLCGHLLGKG